MPGKKSTDDDNNNTTTNNTKKEKKNQEEEEGAVKDSYVCYNKLELLLQLLFPFSSFLPALLSYPRPLPPTYTNSLHKIPNPIKRILAT